MSPPGPNFQAIRSWDGSQDRAFEELCYQLRDPAPPNATVTKVGNPDGGYEWFVRHRNGVEWGWQAKFSRDINVLISGMERSLKTVVDKRPGCRRLTFCIPVDLPDSPAPGKHKSARQKFEDWKVSVRKRVAGARRVKIELWQEGDLLERLAKPEHRGRAWFFWDQEIFGPDWCRSRLAVTADAAGARYQPALNVELPVAFSLEGLGQSSSLCARYRLRRGNFLKSARRVANGRHTGLGVTRELNALRRALSAARHALPRDAVVPGQFDAATMMAPVTTCRELIWAAYPERSPSKHRQEDHQVGILRSDLGQLSHHLDELVDFLSSTAARAAVDGALLMTGAAGQGKTHLFCDAGQRALDDGRPAVVFLGQNFTGTRVFTDLAERLGVAAKGATELLGAMAAAGEACGKPFMLLIDALNDSGDPSAWHSELPVLLAEVALHSPWIALGISVRSSYVDLIASPATDALPTIEHPGFDGYEDDAAHRYFAAFGLEQPRVPLLLPEFTNPLFLLLYCETVRTSGATAPEIGHAHISEIFDRYLQIKNKKICRALRLDPSLNPVGAAIDSFAEAAVDSPREWLPQEEGRRLIDAQAPHLHHWPETLFGQLLAEGILTSDAAYRTNDAGEWERVPSVQITFQRFADYRIANAMLAKCETESELRSMLEVGEPMRAQLLNARAGIIEALAVLLPERFGVELMDAASWGLRDARARRWHAATVESVSARRDDAVTDRTAELLGRAMGHSRDLAESAVESLLSVAARPEHPLNAERLHGWLMRQPMPVRDSVWSTMTYRWMDHRGPLDRLIRWASAGPYPDYPQRVVELAAIPLVWTLTSPNRIMRDYVTKVLCQLLAGSLPVALALLERFREVDDPYVLERLAVATHGAVLVGGDSDKDAALACARRLTEVALDTNTMPDVLVRDAARGAMEWCFRDGLVTEKEYASVQPPYGSAPPETPRTFKQLERTYRPLTSKAREPGYEVIFGSVFGYGDFGRYVIESAARRFLRYRLDRPVPPKRSPRRRQPSAAKLAAFERQLTPEQLATLAGGDQESFLNSLTESQRSELDGLLNPIPRIVDRNYPVKIAQRWIFDRVITLGWTPEKFGTFDDEHVPHWHAGRSGHKPERFGKKYQWIALRELLARLSDNFHMGEPWGDRPLTYDGPWRFYGRQIDPTLPPPERLRDEDGVEYLAPTYPADTADSWWIPNGPQYSGNDEPAAAGWAETKEGVPDFASLVKRTDETGAEWVVLQAYYNWDEQPAEDQDRYERPRRDMWSHIYGWIVRDSDARPLVEFLSTRSLMGKWMPEGCEIIDDAYFPEIPWAAASNELPQVWEAVEPRGGADDAPGIEVYPSWTGYLWEGNVWDCSINDSVSMRVPSATLFESGRLRWKPGSREWTDESGTTVAQFRERDGERQSVLLARATWLERVLREQECALVLGWLGEKQLFGAGLNGGLLGGWTEFNAVGMFRNGKWTLDAQRLNVRQPAR